MLLEEASAAPPAQAVLDDLHLLAVASSRAELRLARLKADLARAASTGPLAPREAVRLGWAGVFALALAWLILM